jgi:two-component system chemotaxis response regulator CheB
MRPEFRIQYVMHRNVIVIGASAGGATALQGLLPHLPRDLPASVFVVLHVAPDSPGMFATILDKVSRLPVSYPKDERPIEKGRVYLAPPDMHLLLEPRKVRVIRGPKENRFRPSIDALFRSAAAHHGPRAIGVLLSGYLDDGVSGLADIKQCGGTTIVQDPKTALVGDMPRNALRHTHVDHKAPLTAIPELLCKLLSEDIPNSKAKHSCSERIRMEADIAANASPSQGAAAGIGVPSGISCPECGGPLWKLGKGSSQRFRCHVGHAYTSAALSEDQKIAVDRALAVGLRGLREIAVLADEMAEIAKRDGNLLEQKVHDFSARRARAEALLVQQILESKLVPLTK